jgi:hypothetical protein
MSLGYTVVKALPKNVQYRWRVVDLTLDTDYPTNGYPLAASSFKLNGIVAVIPLGCESGFIPVWDRSAGTLMMFNPGGDGDPCDECASGLDGLANVIVTCLVVGY